MDLEARVAELEKAGCIMGKLHEQRINSLENCILELKAMNIKTQEHVGAIMDFLKDGFKWLIFSILILALFSGIASFNDIIKFISGGRL